ncbi:MAG: hypothetical protein ACI4Q3_08670 [Kiritimatiellia bacterium]
MLVAFSTAAAILATPDFAKLAAVPTFVTALAKFSSVIRSVTALDADAATAVALRSALPSHQRRSIFEAWSAVTEKPAMIGSPKTTVAVLGVPAGRAKLLVFSSNFAASSISTSGTSTLFVGPSTSLERSVENAPRKLSCAGRALRILRL